MGTRMYQRFCKILLLAIALFFSGCGNPTSEAKAQLRGRLLIWHPFQGKEAETLNLILDNYRELYPKVKIVSESVPEEEISQQFLQQAQSSLGPDLMISSYISLSILIKAGVLLPIFTYA